MTTDTPPPGNLYLIVGYDGSAPASRALDAAVSLLHSRAGRVEVVYVAHLPAIDMMSADAIGEMQADFDDMSGICALRPPGSCAAVRSAGDSSGARARSRTS